MASNFSTPILHSQATGIHETLDPTEAIERIQARIGTELSAILTNLVKENQQLSITVETLTSRCQELLSQLDEQRKQHEEEKKQHEEMRKENNELKERNVKQVVLMEQLVDKINILIQTNNDLQSSGIRRAVDTILKCTSSFGEMAFYQGKHVVSQPNVSMHSCILSLGVLAGAAAVTFFCVYKCM